MTRNLRYVLIAVSMLLIAAGSFVLGVHRGRSISKVLVTESSYYLQADLGLNHLHNYLELEEDLVRGCVDTALEKLSINVDQQKRLIASLYSESELDIIKQILERRDPALLKELPLFKSKYGDAWQTPQCVK